MICNMLLCQAFNNYLNHLRDWHPPDIISSIFFWQVQFQPEISPIFSWQVQFQPEISP